VTSEECFRRLAGDVARLQGSLTPRERLALQAGLRAAHAEEALLAGDARRASAHFEVASRIARALFPKETGAQVSTGFSFDKKWRYFVIRRIDRHGPPKVMATRGPMLLTENETIDEVFQWRSSESAHGVMITVDVWNYTPETGWKLKW
jgi:hypothetical protein